MIGSFGSASSYNYGVEFSPDGRQLYISNFYSLWQIPVAPGFMGIPISIPTTGTDPNWLGAMQLGPDGKIYIARNGMPSIDVINNPNLVAPACGYTPLSVPIAGVCTLGLPACYSMDCFDETDLAVNPFNRDVSASAGTTTFNVASNTSWTVSENIAWLSVNPVNGSGNDTLTVNYDENTSGSIRVGEITVTADGSSPVVVVTLTQETWLIQTVNLPEGWAGLSSYITPFTPNVEDLFAPIVEDMIILRNLIQVYWPEEEVNTIGNWDNGSGYAIKMNTDADFEIGGYEFASTELTLSAGWHYIPVLSSCQVNTMDLFGDNLDDIVIVQELIGIKILWPAQGIYTLEFLEPGKTYKIKVANPFTVTFPDCDSKATTPAFPQVNSINTIWGELNMTPSTAVVAFMESATAGFIKGDVIGVFGQTSRLYGYMEVTGTGLSQVITLFGNDVYTDVSDGFVSNEMISYRLYRPSTKKIFDLDVEYEPTLYNSGLFNINSMSAITGVTLTAPMAIGVTQSGFEESGIRIYPNPSTGIFNIEGFEEMSTIKIYNAFGNEIMDGILILPDKVDLSHQPKGIYFIRIITEKGMYFEKLLIN